MTELEVVTIDCDYLQPRFAAAYLIGANGASGFEAAIIETNTTKAVPRITAELKARSIPLDRVKYVIVTHVHLDHAGGAAALMKLCPGAKLVAHPRAAKHLIDPTKIIQGATQVYGAKEFEKLYGVIEPVPADRVLQMEDESELPLGRGALRFLHTRGHANHHFCVLDPLRGGIFTGDTFGLAYPKLQKKGLFVIPSTSPTDFDPVAAKESVKRVASVGAKRAYLTHYGPISSISSAADQLLEHLDHSEKLMLWASRQKTDVISIEKYCVEDLRGYYESYADRNRLDLGKDDWQCLELDFRLNAQGIVTAARRPAKSSVSQPDS